MIVTRHRNYYDGAQKNTEYLFWARISDKGFLKKIKLK